VILIRDSLLNLETDLLTGKETPITLPGSNVLQFITADGSRISIRPSGTEPKIKFYFGVREPLKNRSEYSAINRKLDRKIEGIVASLGLT